MKYAMCRSDKKRGTNSTGVNMHCESVGVVVFEGGTPNRCWSRYATKLVSMRSHTSFGAPKESCDLNRDDVYMTNNVYHCNSNRSPRSATWFNQVRVSSADTSSRGMCCRNKSITDFTSFIWAGFVADFAPRTSVV
jgi:hypothetical protein